MKDNAVINIDSISKITIKLLEKEEGYDVDFKRDRNGLKPEDLVAFANSPNGGNILIGIDEDFDIDGKQKGKIVGCRVSDTEKLAILGKASECRPPVDIEIFTENFDSDKPFYRIEIPSGQYKPYCTNKGLYLIRGDARNNPLTPEKLLDIFLEENGAEFIERFKYATSELNTNLQKSKDEISKLDQNVGSMIEKVKKDLSKMVSDMDTFSKRVHDQLDDIFSTAEEANESAYDANSEANDINGKIDSIEDDIESIYWMINGIHTHLNIEKPIITKDRTSVKKLTTQIYKSKINEGVKSFNHETLQIEIIEYLKKNRKIKVDLSLVELWIGEQLNYLNTNNISN
jgi:ATP-dependent DNA helicase RecG